MYDWLYDSIPGWVYRRNRKGQNRIFCNSIRYVLRCKEYVLLLFIPMRSTVIIKSTIENMSSFDILKWDLRSIVIVFVEKYALSTDESIDVYITSLLKQNYPRILKTTNIEWAPYHFRYLQRYLRGISKRRIKKILESYEDEYMRILNEDHFARTKQFHEEWENPE